MRERGEKMGIEAYGLLLDRPLTAGEEGALERLLPPDRRCRLQHTRLDKRPQILCAYGLLAYGLRRLGWPALPETALTAEGKPWFPEAPQLCFNLSHTDGAVLCAVYDRPVGVDVERRRPVADSLMERLGAADEDEFWRMWVRREAVAKCRGKGIGVLPHWDGSLEAGVWCRGFSPFPGIYAALAAQEPESPWHCREVVLAELLD